MEAFASEPSLSLINKCRKNELRLIAIHYGITVSSSLVKAELKTALVEELAHRGVLTLPELEEAVFVPHGPLVEVGPEWRVTSKPAVWENRGAEEPVTLPPFPSLCRLISGLQDGAQVACPAGPYADGKRGAGV